MRSERHRPVLFWLAVATAAAALLPIAAGALVTTLDAGMAFSDWPTSDGQGMLSYPWLRSAGDKFVEHGHRLAGMLIGCMSIVFAVSVWLLESRRWVRWCALGVLLAVIVQGLLGGGRVLADERIYAMFHGAFAAAVFAFMSSMALVLSRSWIEPPRVPTGTVPNAVTRCSVLTVTPVVILVQYSLGGLVRHLGRALYEHVGMAIVVLLCVVATIVAVHRTKCAWLRRPAWLMGCVALCAGRARRRCLAHEIRPSLDRLRGRAAHAHADCRSHVAHGRGDAAPHVVGDPAGPRAPHRLDAANRYAADRSPAAAADCRLERGLMTTGPSFSRYVPIEAVPAERLAVSARLADYMELVKPRIAAMVLLTVTVGFTLGSVGAWHVGQSGERAGRHRPGRRRQRSVQPVDRTAHRRPHGPHGEPSVADRSAAADRRWPASDSSARPAGLSLLICRSERDDGPLGVSDTGLVRRCLYAAQTLHRAEHGRRCNPRRAATRAGLDRCGCSARRRGVFPVRALVPVAVSAFPGHRLAASSRLCGGRIANASRGKSCPRIDWPFRFGLRRRADSGERDAGASGPGRGFVSRGRPLVGIGLPGGGPAVLWNESRETARGLLYYSLVYLPILLSVLTWDHVRLLS